MSLSADTFDDIRPYHDGEVNPVLQKMSQIPDFIHIIAKIFPELDETSITQLIQGIDTVWDFQDQLIGKSVRRLLAQSSQEISHSNLAVLGKDKPSGVVISNHRDIVLDSAILNVLLHEAKYTTTQIAVGNNLLKSPIVAALMRLNKSFVVKRDLSPREFLVYSHRLSNYIKHVLQSENTSLWLAQRNGRAKDGNDETQQGLLKMLSIGSGKLSIAKHFSELNLIPMAISYEYESCGFLRARELYIRSTNEGNYTKTADEDKNSMLTGIQGQKGRIHIALGTPIQEELEALQDIPSKNGKLSYLKHCIDKQIHTIYHCWATNYIAYDIVNKTDKYKAHYTVEEEKAFLDFLAEGIKDFEEPKKELTSILLKMYAQPVVNKTKYDTSR